jgi:hypothetical protein
MRVMTILAAICFAVAFALSTSVSAQTERNRPAGTAGAPVQGGTMAPPQQPHHHPPALRDRSGRPGE